MEDLQLQRLVEDAARTPAGDPAWLRLWRVVEPAVWALVDRPRFASHLAHSADVRRRIVGTIHARLVFDIENYLRSRRINPRLHFMRWLRTLTKRIGMRCATAPHGLQLQT